MGHPTGTPALSSPKFSKNNLVRLQYDGANLSFNEDGWFNATEAAELYGKRVDNWLRNEETKAYISALMGDLNTSEMRGLIEARRGKYGGGTWLHPRLAVAFGRWLNVRFAI